MFCIDFEPILPITFDDSISYYEQLLKVNNKLTELVNAFNNLQTDFEAEIDSKIEAFKTSYVDTQDEAIKEELNKAISDLAIDTSEKIAEIYSYANNLAKIERTFCMSEIRRVEDEINDIIIGTIYVMNPIKGYQTTLDTCFNDIYDALRYEGITAYQFDGLQLTATEFDNKNLSAVRFDTLAKKLLYLAYEHSLFDPINGLRDTIQRVMYRWFQEYRTDAITVNTFDELEKTADEFSAYEMSALTFDESAKAVMTPS